MLNLKNSLIRKLLDQKIKYPMVLVAFFSLPSYVSATNINKEHKINFLVEDLENNKIIVCCKKNRKISYLKKFLGFNSKKTGNSAIKLFIRDKILQDEKTLANYGITNDSKIYIFFARLTKPNNVYELDSDKKINVTIQQLGGEAFNIEYNSSYTVSKLKHKIKESRGISEELRYLVFRSENLQDFYPTNFYGISDSSKLYLVLNPNSDNTENPQFLKKHTSLEVNENLGIYDRHKGDIWAGGFIFALFIIALVFFFSKSNEIIEETRKDDILDL